MTALGGAAMAPHSAVPNVTTIRRSTRCALVVAACLSIEAAVATAQQARPSQSDATRATLEAQAAAAERGTRPADRARAAAIRERLRRGDFSTGDQLILEIEGGERPVSDTVTVRSGPVIRVDGFSDISVGGVLRSELQAHLTREFRRFMIAPRVTARPLVRLTVTGAVARPGFYVVPYDHTVSDVIMDAGGPAPNAKLEKTELRRGDRTVHESDGLSRAMREGRTLDELGAANGDVINVGARRSLGGAQVFQVVGLLVSVVTIAASLARR